MDYYSEFKFNCVNDQGKKAVDKLKKLSGHENFVFDDIKWYYFKEHLLTVVKQYPEAIFTVERFGEDKGDFEKTFVKKGKIKIVKAIIQISEPDWW